MNISALLSNRLGPSLTSCLCIQAHWDTRWFPRWSTEMKENPTNLHRKLWEYCFITQVLYERGMLREGIKGLGFAVGKEPLSSLFASYGSHVLATDLDYKQSQQGGWVETNQHANALADLNERGLCEPKQFEQFVDFQSVDMNAIPENLQGFDFLWSCCAFEHLGSIQQGLDFVYNAMNCLKPGGVAVHTSDFNLSSNDETIDHDKDVLFRKRDILELVRRSKRAGHYVAPLNFFTGWGETDRFISRPPYIQDSMHLKLRIESYVATSIGLIIHKRLMINDLREYFKRKRDD